METLELGNGKSIRFASVEHARLLLSTPDEFTTRLSPIERSTRMRTGKAIRPEDFLAFAAASAREWQTSDDREFIRRAIAIVRPRLEAYSRLLPDQIDLVKTSGDEEGGAAYTRNCAVFLPQVRFDRMDYDLPGLFVHEFFHILTRCHPDLRDHLYAAIGYRRCNEIRLPGDLTEREITNPDSPHNCHYIDLEWQGKTHAFVPAIYSSRKRYSRLRGGSHFKSLVFRMLGVEEQEGEWRPSLGANEKPILVNLDQLGGFYEQVGRNTNCVVQPEEILASNFTLLVLGQTEVASPEILLKLDKVLKEYRE